MVYYSIFKLKNSLTVKYTVLSEKQKEMSFKSGVNKEVLEEIKTTTFQ